MRIPGSPGTRFTPLHQLSLGPAHEHGQRIALEIKEAVEQTDWEKFLT